MIDFTKEEVMAVANAIQTAWQNGVKEPGLAHHLLQASHKLGVEYDRQQQTEEIQLANKQSSKKETQSNEPPVVQGAKKNVPVAV